MHKGIALLPALVLCACQAPGEHTAAVCRAQGYTAGTLDFEACRQSVEHEVLVAHADQAEAENRAKPASMIMVRH
jgi:hypothetical protein